MERIAAFIAGARKFVVAVANALVVTGTALQDANVDGDEWGLIVAAWAAALAVYQVSNRVGSVDRKR